ncbi:hypothetical protein [Nannocystis pusilla]
MTDSGDIWQRYDAKVLHIQQLEARVAELEERSRPVDTSATTGLRCRAS